MSLCEQKEEEEAVYTPKAAFPEPTCVSMKSDVSMENPLNFSNEAVTSNSICTSGSTSHKQTCKHTQLEETADLQHDFYQPMGDVLQKVKDQHKTSMKNKYGSLFEGIKLQENQIHLDRIYTQLYIIDGESRGVNEEHEVLQMEKTHRTQHSQDTPINCNDIFNPLHEPSQDKQRKQEKEKIKTVLTKGIAGIGKTVSVHKFILDWAEGQANLDVDFMFVLPFRELNLIKNEQYSLHRLLLDFHPELQSLNSEIYHESKVVLIFDGLDESRVSLMFSDSEFVSDVNVSSSPGAIMANLIKGKLLPSAFIWITSRPAAASQIPSKYINRVTEIQGFSDPQKEEYFRKKISDQHQASRIISHIRKTRSLHIMCHIPVFCWISASVLQNILKKEHGTEIPKTLTEMYIRFLLTQINIRNQKYESNPDTILMSSREVIVKLAELAFKQLMKGNVMFYEEDLRECGIDVTGTSVYSGICTEIFKEESVIHQRKVYCFIHLSFQEFLAAFFLFYSCAVKNLDPLKLFWEEGFKPSKDNLLGDFLEAAFNKSLESKNGHLDLFLRFLLGVSLESNQRLYHHLLTETVNSSETIKHITQYIKDKIKSHIYLSADRCINLFLCLLEINDQTLYKEIQDFLKSKSGSKKDLSLAQCSTIAYMIQISEEVLDEFDLKKYSKSEEGRRRLIPAVMNCRKALFSDCKLTSQCYKSVASSLQSSNSSLRELDLSNNDLRDSTAKLLSYGLKSENCQLNILRLAGCNLTGQCCESLASSLRSSNSSLTELNLSKNDLQDSGVNLLSNGLRSLNCRLNILRLTGCNLTGQCCEHLASALQSSNSSLKELDLSNNDLQDLGMKLLSNGLRNSNSQLNILKLAGCNLTGQCCESLASALQSSNSSLRELDLSNNNLNDYGVMLFMDGLKSLHCQLNILRLTGCNITVQCCESLASALQSSNSSLRELDLSNNDLQDSGIKLLSDGLKSENCQLNILRLCGCIVTEEGCCHLASALCSKPSHLRELDLSYNHPGESGVKMLSCCKLEKLNVAEGGELRVTPGLQKYAKDLTLDLNTANSLLALSERNRKVTYVKEKQSYPDHPERFDERPQILCKEKLYGRCYWEVEWSGVVEISVAYKEINRKGGKDDCWFGFNDKSWSLNCCSNSFTARHNNKSTDIPVPSNCMARVGVYLDCSAGILSFYSISETHTLTHLHTFTSTFTEPLYSGFRICYSNHSVRLCQIKPLSERNSRQTHS